MDKQLIGKWVDEGLISQGRAGRMRVNFLRTSGPAFDRAVDRPGAVQGVTVLGLPEAIRDWDVIGVSGDEANEHLATNHLVLNDRAIVVPAEAAHDGEAVELEKRRFEVFRLPCEAVYRMGGSFRCAHQPLVRI